MNKLCRVCMFAAAFFACAAVYAQQAAGSQNFPERSVQGRAQMSPGITPVQLPDRQGNARADSHNRCADTARTNGK